MRSLATSLAKIRLHCRLPVTRNKMFDVPLNSTVFLRNKKYFWHLTQQQSYFLYLALINRAGDLLVWMGESWPRKPEGSRVLPLKIRNVSLALRDSVSIWDDEFEGTSSMLSIEWTGRVKWSETAVGWSICFFWLRICSKRNLIWPNLIYLFFYVSVLVHVAFFLYFCQPISPIMPRIFHLKFCNRFNPIYLASVWPLKKVSPVFAEILGIKFILFIRSINLSIGFIF